MKIIFRLLLLAGALFLACWLWALLFPSPEKLVLGKMSRLAALTTFDAKDGNISRAVKVGNLISLFAVDAEISFNAPGQAEGTRTLSGRDEIRDAARVVFARLTMLKVEFLDPAVQLGADKQTAAVTCTARVYVGDSKDCIVQEMQFQWKKVEGTWVISRAETVKTLQ